MKQLHNRPANTARLSLVLSGSGAPKSKIPDFTIEDFGTTIGKVIRDRTKPEVVISGPQELTIHGLPAVRPQFADDSDIERLLNYYKESFMFGYHTIDDAKALTACNNHSKEFSVCMAYLFQNNNGEQAIHFNISDVPVVYSRQRPRDLEPNASKSRLKQIRKELSKHALLYIAGADMFVLQDQVNPADSSILISYCLKLIQNSLQRYIDFTYQEATKHNEPPNYWGSRLEFPAKRELKANSPLWKPCPKRKHEETEYRWLLVVNPDNVTPPVTN